MEQLELFEDEEYKSQNYFEDLRDNLISNFYELEIVRLQGSILLKENEIRNLKEEIESDNAVKNLIILISLSFCAGLIINYFL